jgi:hypothetical protein
MVVGGLGVVPASGIVDGALSGDGPSVADRGSVRLELGVGDTPVDDGFIPSPIDEEPPRELADPDTADRGWLDPDRPYPEPLGDERLEPERLVPDTLEDWVALEERLDVAGGVDMTEVPLVPTEDPELDKGGRALALLMPDDSGRVKLGVLPAIGLDASELGLHGCWNGVGLTGGLTGEVGLCTDRGA